MSGKDVRCNQCDLKQVNSAIWSFPVEVHIVSNLSSLFFFFLTVSLSSRQILSLSAAHSLQLQSSHYFVNNLSGKKIEILIFFRYLVQVRKLPFIGDSLTMLFSCQGFFFKVDEHSIYQSSIILITVAHCSCYSLNSCSSILKWQNNGIIELCFCLYYHTPQSCAVQMNPKDHSF